MKARSRTVLVACFAIAMFKNICTSVEISSQIELDSDEDEETSNSLTLNETVNLNRPANTSESFLRTLKQPLASWRRKSELVSEPTKRRIFTLHASDNDSSSQQKVVNKIQIVLNNNDSIPSANSCKQGVCNVSVSSRPDAKGNIVTKVCLSIVTSIKSNVQVDDVPVIDGFQGVRENQSEQPSFYPINTPNLAHSYPHRNAIPQIQSNYRGYGEPWYQFRRTLQRPQTYWNYRQVDDYDYGRFRGHKTWPHDRPMVDDKIEPPLSKTKATT